MSTFSVIDHFYWLRFDLYDSFRIVTNFGLRATLKLGSLPGVKGPTLYWSCTCCSLILSASCDADSKRLSVRGFDLGASAHDLTPWCALFMEPLEAILTQQLLLEDIFTLVAVLSEPLDAYLSQNDRRVYELLETLPASLLRRDGTKEKITGAGPTD